MITVDLVSRWMICIVLSLDTSYTPKNSQSVAPENGWLEYFPFLFGWGPFSGAMLNFGGVVLQFSWKKRSAGFFLESISSKSRKFGPLLCPIHYVRFKELTLQPKCYHLKFGTNWYKLSIENSFRRLWNKNAGIMDVSWIFLWIFFDLPPKKNPGFSYTLTTTPQLSNLPLELVRNGSKASGVVFFFYFVAWSSGSFWSGTKITKLSFAVPLYKRGFLRIRWTSNLKVP